ncbi:hypothetical protein BX589_12071 [Paraburkholderia fungorum]|jgi:hypothetical protein|nr:hypothetical protein BX589_12071 [Paraburkholderia fungorum]
MTISSTANKAILYGNGVATSFPYKFLIPNQSQLMVIVTDPLGNQTTLTVAQYSVSGINSPNGGAVTYPLSGSPLPALWSITILRTLPIVQLTDIVNQSGFFPDVVESAMDYQTMTQQQLSEAQSRSISFPVVDDQTAITPVLPAAAARATKPLIFDASGNVTTGQQAYQEPQALLDQAKETAETIAAGVAPGSGTGTFIQNGIGARVRTFQDKQRDIIDVRDWPVKLDGVNDDTSAVQRAIDDIAINSADSTYSGNGIAVLNIPGCKVALSRLVMRSGVIIRGCGSSSTFILPAGGTPFVFDMVGLDDTHLAAHIGLEGLYIATNGQTATDGSYARVTTGGINMSYIERGGILRDVKVNHLDGTLLYMQNAQDIDAFGCEFLFGNDNIVIDASAVNPSNAIKFYGGRSEGGRDRLLKINPANGMLPPRDIQFHGTKFECRTLSDVASAIDIGYVESVSFLGSNFVPTSTAKAMISVKDSGSGAQPRGVKLIGCSSSVPTANVCKMVDATGSGTTAVCLVVGGTWRGLGEYAFTGRCAFDGNDAFECSAPVIAPDDFIEVGVNRFDSITPGPSGITVPVLRGSSQRTTTAVPNPIVIGTAYRNGSANPVVVYTRVTLTPSGSASATAEPKLSKDNVTFIPLGSKSRPAAATAASEPFTFTVPPGWYFRLDATAGVTSDTTVAFDLF